MTDRTATDPDDLIVDARTNQLLGDLSAALGRKTAEIIRLTERVAHLENEREEAISVLDKYAPLPESEAKTLPQRIADEMADFMMVIDHCSKAYDYLTGGLISKPNTLWSEVERIAEDRFTAQVREAVAEEPRRSRGQGEPVITDELLDQLYREATIVRGKGEAFAAMRAILGPESDPSASETPSITRWLRASCSFRVTCWGIAIVTRPWRTRRDGAKLKAHRAAGGRASDLL